MRFVFLDIKKETVPCWYEISWRNGHIILRIHHDFINSTGGIPNDAPIVGQYIQEFNFSDFSGEFGKNFGFEDSLKFLKSEGDFFEYSVPNPQIKKATNKKCINCKGTGKDRFSPQNRCLFCLGKGFDFIWDFSEAYAISASLSIVLKWMKFPQTKTSCQLPQLMCLDLVTFKGLHGATVNGDYSREALEWMKKRGRGIIPEMVLAMKSVWGQMNGGVESFEKSSFRADISDSPGWLCTDLPGNACGLHPDNAASYDIGNGYGYEFSSHNVDSPQQQLTILASLAALHDLMRRG